MIPTPVTFEADGALLRGDLTIPTPACGVVVFVHGSGSSRLSSRNRYVAAELNRRHLATFLFDLLTEDEDLDRSFRFDIGLLTDRLSAAMHWLGQDPVVRAFPLGLFGASTGAAAALAASCRWPDEVKAVVSRGGRPDLAYEALHHVHAPTLLIVGGLDAEVLELNQMAYSELACQDKAVSVVIGADHLFTQAGALEQVAQMAGDWFVPRLCPQTL